MLNRTGYKWRPKRRATQETELSVAAQDQFTRPVATGAVILRLPVPPSTNNLFANGTVPQGVRFVTKTYRDWRTEAGFLLNKQRPGRFTCPVEIIISVQEPKQSADIDNRTKAPIDLLVAHQVIASDDNSCVRKVTAQWADVVGMVVEIIPHQAAAQC